MEGALCLLWSQRNESISLQSFHLIRLLPFSLPVISRAAASHASSRLNAILAFLLPLSFLSRESPGESGGSGCNDVKDITASSSGEVE